MSRVAIIGKGTAGCLAVAYFYKQGYDITWYYNSSKKAQAVGEGAQLNLPSLMYKSAGWNFDDWREVDGNYKIGIHYRNWGDKGDYFHNFLPPQVSQHFNAVKLQNLIFNLYKDKVKCVDGDIEHKDIPEDYIFDCSGKPKDYSKFNASEFIPVNSVHVTQCYWEYPEFDYTVTCARPYGWVFGIPLQNRCSIGYLYNKDFNTLDEVKEDVKNVFADYELTPSQDTNSFSFENYYRKKNFEGNVAYCGNSSFFLEPMEATSILTMEWIMRKADDLWQGYTEEETANQEYLDWNRECEHIIMMHYAAGSRWFNDFWTYAKTRGQNCLTDARGYPKWKEFVNAALTGEYDDISKQYGGGWAYHSFAENLEGLGVHG